MRTEFFISMDDTDVRGGEGTGRLAQRIAEKLDMDILGITRHQLLIHPSIRYTERNSCNVIMVRSATPVYDVFEEVREIILKRFKEGSDPGLAVAEKIPRSIVEFGLMAQRSVLTKQDASSLANKQGIRLEEIGGTGDGVIGALAGLGLCSSGSDGRYVMLKGLRELRGSVSVAELRQMGIDTLLLDGGRRLEEGSVAAAGRIRPSRLDGKPILFVVEKENRYYPVTL